MMLLGICIAYAFSSNVYAASGDITVRVSGNYLYIPVSAGCPNVVTLKSYNRNGEVYAAYSAIYWKYDWTYDDTDSDGAYSNGDWYFEITGSPVVIGSEIRYQLVGTLERMSYNSNGYMRKSVPYPTTYDIPSRYLVKSSSHSFPSANNTNATCTTAATKRCTVCGAVQNVGSALGHLWGDGTTAGAWVTDREATVYNEGARHQVCLRDHTHVGSTSAIPKKNFQIYAGSSRIQKVYQGEALIMNAASGSETLVK